VSRTLFSLLYQSPLQMQLKYLTFNNFLKLKYFK